MNKRVRTCNDRFRSKHGLSIEPVSDGHCYCLHSGSVQLAIPVYEGHAACSSYGLRCVRLLQFRSVNQQMVNILNTDDYRRFSFLFAILCHVTKKKRIYIYTGCFVTCGAHFGR